MYLGLTQRIIDYTSIFNVIPMFSSYTLIISGFILWPLIYFWVEFCTGKDTIVSEPFTEVVVFFSNRFLAPLLKDCSCKALLDSGFHTVFYWSMCLVYVFVIMVLEVAWNQVLSYLQFCSLCFFFSFWDFFSKSWYSDESWIDSVSLIIPNCIMHEWEIFEVFVL